MHVKNTYELAPCQPTLSQQLSAINSRINRPTFPSNPSLSLNFPQPSLSIPFSQPLSNETPTTEPMETQSTTTDAHTYENNNSTNNISTETQNGNEDKQLARQLYPIA